MITRVLAVERLRKVNALVGFTRIDDMDRVGDLPRRLAPADPNRPADVDRGHRGPRGRASSFSSTARPSPAWEDRILGTELWQAHREAHRRNFERRFSETAEEVDPDTRLRPPRYWLVHTLAHVLIRELAMICGYSAASLSERLYAWPEAPGRPAAAGLLICTTASDSDGTLGGLVQLSEPDRLERVVSGSAVPGEPLLVGPDLRDADPAGPRGLPARRRLPLLRHGVGDLVRAGQPVPRPPVPHRPARERCWVLRTRPLRRRGSWDGCSPAPRRRTSLTGWPTATP